MDVTHFISSEIIRGLFSADASGATLEFFRGRITPDIADAALRMPGGGALQVGKGQITDDSELAISLMHGLRHQSPKKGFPHEAVARQYKSWFLTNPFDIGITCSKAFSSPEDSKGLLHNKMIAQASGAMTSEANGALMRAAPISIWAHRESPETIAKYAREDCLLSHPSPVCQSCNVLYCVALAHLISHPGDASGAIALIDKFAATANEKVRSWWFEDSVSQSIESLEASVNIGHVRWAFTMTMSLLREVARLDNDNTTPEDKDRAFEGFFEASIKRVLLRGGDTDTNAAIVGAFLAALLAGRRVRDSPSILNQVPISSVVPSWMIDPVIKWGRDMKLAAAKSTSGSGRGDGGHARPAWLSASAALEDVLPDLLKQGE